MFSRSRLKWGLLGCLIILAVAAMLQAETFAPLSNYALYLVKTGSAASAIAICLALVATA
jgi:hypothetical protein